MCRYVAILLICLFVFACSKGGHPDIAKFVGDWHLPETVTNGDAITEIRLAEAPNYSWSFKEDGTGVCRGDKCSWRILENGNLSVTSDSGNTLVNAPYKFTNDSVRLEIQQFWPNAERRKGQEPKTVIFRGAQGLTLLETKKNDYNKLVAEHELTSKKIQERAAACSSACARDFPDAFNEQRTACDQKCATEQLAAERKSPFPWLDTVL